MPVASVLLLTACCVQAQQPSPGEIGDADWGIRFTPPEGWTRHPAPNGYLFASPSQQGVLLVLPHEARTVEALRAEARRGIADGAGTQLHLEGPIEAFGGDGLAADFSGRIEGTPARARVVGLVAPHGRGATVLAAASPQHYSDALKAQAEAVARTVVFAGPATETTSARASPSQSAGTEEAEWEEYLRGCRLYLNSSYDSGDGSGYIDETTLDLCPGSFTFSGRSLTVFGEMDPVSGDAPSLHSNEQGAGQWRIVRQGNASVLQLRFHDGRTQTLTLGWDDGKTYLDGRRWLRTCDASTSVGPQCH